MQKISNNILNLSSKKLSIFLIIYPLILVLIHTILSVFYRNSIKVSNISNDIIPMLLNGIEVLFLIPVLLLLLWLRATTLSVEKLKLGLPIKWFHLVFGLFLFYIIFNLSRSTLVDFLQNTADDFTWIIYASSETINFIGLLICYPLICHYSARAIHVYKESKNATFANSIVFTLLLIFIPISIPFLHNYVSSINTKNSTLIKIYTIGFGIVFLIFMIALYASIAGIF